MAGKFTLPFLRKEQVAQDMYSFFFDRTVKKDFDFIAGQYIRMFLPHSSPDDRGTSRYFTIASSPTENDYLMITTKVVQSSFKKTLFNLKEGDIVEFFGPSGSYVLDNSQRPHIFLSGGMGITPFRSMLTFASDKTFPIPITLIASFPKEETMVFYEELQAIANKSSKFKVVFSLTQPGKNWEGERGRITDNLLDRYLKRKGNETFYVAGPDAMVDNTRELLVNMGIDVEAINVEYFSGY